jgi:hypothetical protein
MAKQDPPTTSRVPGCFLKLSRSKKQTAFRGSEVFTAVHLSIPFFWDMTLHYLVIVFRRFKGT